MKESVVNLFYKIGSSSLARMASSLTSRDVQFLMYHRVLSSEDCQNEGAGISTSTEIFESHLELLTANYTPIAIDKIFDQDFLGQLSQPPVVVTFDDGYKDNFTLALPLLEKYNVPAIFYIATDMIDGPMRMWWYELDEILNSTVSLKFHWCQQDRVFSLNNRRERKRAYNEIRKLFISSQANQHEKLLNILRKGLQASKQPETMTWDDLRLMTKNPLVTIGAHTVNHPILANLTAEEVREECLQSQKRLETQLGIRVEHFAYPFGSKKEAYLREYEILRNLHFKTAVTTLAAQVDLDDIDFLAIPRLAIKKRTTAAQLKVKLSGWNYLFNGVQI